MGLSNIIDLVKYTRLVRAVKDAIDSSNHEVLVKELVRLGVPTDEAEEFTRLIVSLRDAKNEEVTEKVINFIINVAKKKNINVSEEELRDNIEGIVEFAKMIVELMVKKL